MKSEEREEREKERREKKRKEKEEQEGGEEQMTEVNQKYRDIYMMVEIL